MSKRTRMSNKKIKKLTDFTLKQPKRGTVWGKVERMRRSGQYIAAVEFPSGRSSDDVRTFAASERSKQVTHVQTIYRIRPDDEASSCPDVRHGSSEQQDSSSVRTPNMYRPND
jgi:hypothetical protein